MLITGAIILWAVLQSWQLSFHTSQQAADVVAQHNQTESAVTYGLWWLSQDLSAAQLNTSTPTQSLTIPPPLDAPVSHITLNLTDPITSLAISGSTTVTMTTNAVWAFNATAYDAEGHLVSLNDVTINWQASTPSGSTGQGDWVSPGVWQATAAGTVSITIPSITTSSGTVLAVKSNTITVSIANTLGNSTPTAFVTPATNTMTLDAVQPLTALALAANGDESVITDCTWTASSGSLSSTTTGATWSASTIGSSTLTCTYPNNGSTDTITTTAQVQYPTRIVALTPQNLSPNAIIHPLATAIGPQVTITRW
jgi:hypothetical protein